MRRIAREVGAGAMSLYWYVSSKEELLDLMLDAIDAEIEVPDPSGDWRADLAAFAHRTRDALRRHRWAVEFIGTRPPSGPNDVRNLERLLGLLDGLGVEDVRLIMGIFMTVATFVIGAVVREAQEVRFQRRAGARRGRPDPRGGPGRARALPRLVRGLGRVPAHRPADEVRRRPGRPGHPGGAVPVQPGLRPGRHRRPPGRRRCPPCLAGADSDAGPSRPGPPRSGGPAGRTRRPGTSRCSTRPSGGAGRRTGATRTASGSWPAACWPRRRWPGTPACARRTCASTGPAASAASRTASRPAPGGTLEHSVAHSGDLVAVAVTGNPVGVDVEQLDGRPHPLGGDGDTGALARLVLSGAEQAALGAIPPAGAPGPSWSPGPGRKP